MHEENLSQFSLLSAEAVDELWSLLASPCAEKIGAEAETASEGLPRYIAVIQAIEEAAAASSMAGLQSICAMLEANLQTLYTQGRALNSAQLVLLEEWPECLMGYVISQGEASAIDLLLLNMAAAAWPLPLCEADVACLKRGLLLAPAESATPLSPLDSCASHNQLQPNGLSGEKAPAAIVQEIDSEMIAMLRNEFSLMTVQGAEDLAAAVSQHFSTEERRVALTNYVELLARLGTVSESVGLIALGSFFARVGQMLMATVSEVNAAQQALLEQVSGRVSAYLARPNDDSTCAALIDLLADAAWNAPMTADEITEWTRALGNVVFIANSENKIARQVQATEEDVSLLLADDINAELLDGLLQELPLQTAAFTLAIERVAAGMGTAGDIGRAMRAAHTLKGAANTVGVRGIANLTHHLEDILLALAEGNAMPDTGLAAMLVNAGDALEAMSEALMGVGPIPEQSCALLQSVLDYANLIDSEGIAVVAAGTLSSVEEEAEPTQVARHKMGAQEASQAEQAHGIRVSAPVVDELLRLAGETLIANSQIQDRLRHLVRQAETMQQQQNLVIQLVAELENLVDIRGLAEPQPVLRGIADFDPLEFDHFSELHTVTRRLIEASSDSQQILSQVQEQFGTLGEVLEVQQRLQMANQHAVIRTRMVPVSSVASRLQRGVRQTCRLLDKQVELVINGDTTNIDSSVLTDLMDPLMHLLRNAVDHGIDDAQAREAAGKSPIGRIELSFAREGNSIVVRCKDDGAGLDYETIRRIAESKGMISAEHNPSQEELARMILVNGFSTRDETTQVSGRGIGMDVVYNRVLQMKGTLALHSNQGTGLTVELRLPATLLSAHTLIVRQGEKLLAVSSRGVEDIHYITPAQIENIGTQEIYRNGNVVLSLVKFETLLGLPRDKREADRLGFPLLLTRMDDGAITAVLVQEVIDGREVVLKKFGRYVPRIIGSVGAVILGDGSVAPVIDLVDLLRVPVQSLTMEQSAAEAKSVDLHDESAALLTALVVDDSFTARRAAAKLMREAGYAVRTAMDGFEAVAILQNFVPNVMLVDMEMPRMNGLELTAHVKNGERTKHIPVIMITSRSTEKHRQQGKAAGVDVYLTKPYSDDVLLDHVVHLTGR